MSLLSKNNTKLLKGEELNVLTYGLSLAPAKKNGIVNLCKHASRGCLTVCLDLSGMGIFKNVQAARLKKALAFVEHQAEFLTQLNKEIAAKLKSAKRKGMRCAIRLNVLSDVAWHELIDMPSFSEVQFYDYTPNPGRMLAFLRGELPSNYHLTFSRKENNQSMVELIASMGGNIATVFSKLPETYLGKPVIDGDVSDARFLDPKGVIVGLKAKGSKGKKDESGFVIQVA